jgi:thiamine pyrophosphate-dependent acetolactate synthase large subunit-like protein
MVAPMENIEAALNLLEKAERPLVLVGKGMAFRLEVANGTKHELVHQQHVSDV